MREDSALTRMRSGVVARVAVDIGWANKRTAEQTERTRPEATPAFLRPREMAHRTDKRPPSERRRHKGPLSVLGDRSRQGFQSRLIQRGQPDGQQLAQGQAARGGCVASCAEPVEQITTGTARPERAVRRGCQQPRLISTNARGGGARSTRSAERARAVERPLKVIDAPLLGRRRSASPE